MPFKLTFTTDNAAFEDGYEATEVCRILREVAEKIEAGEIDGGCWDINGNRVGAYSLTP